MLIVFALSPSTNKEMNMNRSITVLIIAFISICAFMVPTAYAGKGGPTKGWDYVGATNIKNNPGLIHYEWETERYPYDQFDKIALHRFVYEPNNRKLISERPAPDKRKVIFIIPGTWSQGSSKGTDPEITTSLFLALNGYDVYSMDFRTKYLPNHAYDQYAQFGMDISSTANWTYDLFREDIKACVNLTKKLSRAKKIFLAGRSRGSTQMYIYASKYWRQDLKGLISLDGGIKGKPPIEVADLSPEEIEEATEAYEASVEIFKDTGTLLSEVSGYELGQFAGQIPYSTSNLNGPLPPNFNNVSELIAYGAYYAWGAGLVTNIYTPYPDNSGETYMDLNVLVDIYSNFTRYWPERQNLESAAFRTYDDCPFLDYDDNLDKVDIPVIAFGGELTCRGGCTEDSSTYYSAHMTKTNDVTVVYLPGYGHLDVYAGTHSLEDVKQPLLEWLDMRR